MIIKIKALLILTAFSAFGACEPVLKKFEREATELQGNWSIRYEYDGKTLVNSASGQRTYIWPNGLAQNQPGINPSIISQGRIKAILEWQGSGPAPKTVNIVANVYALAEGMSLMFGIPSERFVDNGYEDEIIEEDSAMWEEGKHLKTLAVNNGVATFTHFLSASSIATGLGTTDTSIQFRVNVDPRFAFISIAGHPANYQKKVTGHLKVYTIRYSNGTSENFTYPEAIPVANNMLGASDSPLTTSGTLDIGLPPRDQDGFYNAQLGIWSYTPPTIAPIPVSFEGNVYQLLIPNERYDWESDQGGFASDLPTLLHGWTIRTNNNAYEAPKILVQHSNGGIPSRVSTSLGAVDTGGWVRLKYRWSDGVQATSEAQLKFHVDPDNNQTIHSYLDFNPTVGWSSVPFDKQWIEDPIPYPVIVQPRIWALQVGAVTGSLAVAALSAMDPPLGVLFSVAAVVYELNVDTDTGGPVTKNYPAPGQSDFDDADTNGRISPPNWREYTEPPFNLGDFKWNAEYRPKHLYTHRVKDRWGLGGYLGQETGVSAIPQDMISSPKRYNFDLKRNRL